MWRESQARVTGRADLEVRVGNCPICLFGIRVPWTSGRNGPLYPCRYNHPMTLTQQVQKDMVDAMRAKQELRLSTLRMMKAALQNKRIEKRADLDEKEELQVFTTMIKQRKDSIDQFEKGNRHELAQKEAQEITIIEAYMPKAVGQEEIEATVRGVIAEMGAPTMKDMGTVMKNAKAKFGDARVDGKLLSEAVKKQLGG